MDEYGLECAVMRRCHMNYLDFIVDKGLQERIMSEEEKAKSLSLWSITCRFCVRDECTYKTLRDSSGVVFYFSCFRDGGWQHEKCYFQYIPYGYGVSEWNYQIGITAVRTS